MFSKNIFYFPLKNDFIFSLITSTSKLLYLLLLLRSLRESISTVLLLDNLNVASIPCVPNQARKIACAKNKHIQNSDNFFLASRCIPRPSWCERRRLWVRSPLEKMKHLFEFIFSFLRSGFEAKRSVEFRQYTNLAGTFLPICIPIAALVYMVYHKVVTLHSLVKHTFFNI